MLDSGRCGKCCGGGDVGRIGISDLELVSCVSWSRREEMLGEYEIPSGLNSRTWILLLSSVTRMKSCFSCGRNSAVRTCM